MSGKYFKNKVVNVIIAVCFLTNIFGSSALGQGVGLVPPSLQLPVLRYLSVNSANPYNYFNFLLERGEISQAQSLNSEAKKLINYFFLGISLDADAFWVNLRPQDADKITSDELGRTDMGKVLLEQDLELKKDVAQYLHPDNAYGAKFWEKLYIEIGKDKVKKEKITTSQRVWIVPDKAVIIETADGAFISEAKLKVLLENEYLKINPQDQTQALSEALMKEIIIPKLSDDVNRLPKYSALRQIYYALILAEYFKRVKGQGLRVKDENVKDAYVSLINQNTTQGLESGLPWSKQNIWQEYLASYQKGEYQVKRSLLGLARMYFSGGISPYPGGSPGMTNMGVGGSGVLEITPAESPLAKMAIPKEEIDGFSSTVAERNGGGATDVGVEVKGGEGAQSASPVTLDELLNTLARDGSGEITARLSGFDQETLQAIKKSILIRFGYNEAMGGLLYGVTKQTEKNKELGDILLGLVDDAIKEKTSASPLSLDTAVEFLESRAREFGGRVKINIAYNSSNADRLFEETSIGVKHSYNSHIDEFTLAPDIAVKTFLGFARDKFKERTDDPFAKKMTVAIGEELQVSSPMMDIDGVERFLKSLPQINEVYIFDNESMVAWQKAEGILQEMSNEVGYFMSGIGVNIIISENLTDGKKVLEILADKPGIDPEIKNAVKVKLIEVAEDKIEELQEQRARQIAREEGKMAKPGEATSAELLEEIAKLGKVKEALSSSSPLTNVFLPFNSRKGIIVGSFYGEDRTKHTIGYVDLDISNSEVRSLLVYAGVGGAVKSIRLLFSGEGKGRTPLPLMDIVGAYGKHYRIIAEEGQLMPGYLKRIYDFYSNVEGFTNFKSKTITRWSIPSNPPTGISFDIKIPSQKTQSSSPVSLLAGKSKDDLEKSTDEELIAILNDVYHKCDRNPGYFSKFVGEVYFTMLLNVMAKRKETRAQLEKLLSLRDLNHEFRTTIGKALKNNVVTASSPMTDKEFAEALIGTIEGLPVSPTLLREINTALDKLTLEELKELEESFFLEANGPDRHFQAYWGPIMDERVKLVREEIEKRTTAASPVNKKDAVKNLLEEIGEEFSLDDDIKIFLGQTIESEIMINKISELTSPFNSKRIKAATIAIAETDAKYGLEEDALSDILHGLVRHYGNTAGLKNLERIDQGDEIFEYAQDRYNFYMSSSPLKVDALKSDDGLGGIDLNGIKIELKKYAAISEEEKRDAIGKIKALLCVDALLDKKWHSLAHLYLQEIMLLVKHKVISEIEERDKLLTAARALRDEGYLTDEQGLRFLGLLEKGASFAEIQSALIRP